MGNGQYSFRQPPRPEGNPSVSQWTQTKLAILLRQGHGQRRHRGLACLEKNQPRQLGSSREAGKERSPGRQGVGENSYIVLPSGTQIMSPAPGRRRDSSPALQQSSIPAPTKPRTTPLLVPLRASKFHRLDPPSPASRCSASSSASRITCRDCGLS